MQLTFGNESSAKVSATGRASYFRAFTGAFSDAEDRTSPDRLAALLAGVRKPFKTLYLIAPRWRDLTEADYQVAMEKWRAEVSEGEKTCTHEHISKLFSTALQDIKEWPNDDAAVDHLETVIHSLAKGRESSTSNLLSADSSLKRKLNEAPSYNSRSGSAFSLGGGSASGASSLAGSFNSGEQQSEKSQTCLTPAASR